MAKLVWPGQEALGKRFAIVTTPNLFQVVGVVGTTIVGQIGEDPQPVAYFPMRQQYSPFATLIVRTTSNPEPCSAPCARACSSSTKIWRSPMGRDRAADSGARPVGRAHGRGVARLFGALALILASIGIYGVLAYSVAQRTSEIGLRMALGAQPRQVLGLVLKQGMLLALVGAIVGVVVRCRSLAWRRSPVRRERQRSSHLWGITLLMMGVALLACYLPARRATRIDPLVALRVD